MDSFSKQKVVMLPNFAKLYIMLPKIRDKKH